MKTVWAGAVAAGAVLLLAACAPAAEPAQVPIIDPPPYPFQPGLVAQPTPEGTVHLPAEVPLPGESIINSNLSRGFIWIKGQYVQLPAGVRFTNVVPMRGGAWCTQMNKRYCPREVWTLYKGAANFQFSPTDGIVINDSSDPLDPSAFAFLGPYVTPAGNLFDDWTEEQRRSAFVVVPPPETPSGPREPPGTDLRRAILAEDYRVLEINGNRVALPEGVLFAGTVHNDCLPQVRCAEFTAVFRKGNARIFVVPTTGEVVTDRTDPADPTAFDFLKPYLPPPWGEGQPGPVRMFTAELPGTSTPQ